MIDMDKVRALMADPEFGARARASRVAQGLPPVVEDEAVYRLIRNALSAPKGGAGRSSVASGRTRQASGPDRPKRARPAA